MILVILIPLIVATACLWSLLTPSKTPPPASPPALLTGSQSTSPIVRLPNSRLFPLLHSGPVASAAEATTRAVMAANEAALRDYRVEPFADGKSSASFDGQRWLWRKRIGYGRGDFEAEVSIAPSGLIENVIVRYTTQQLANRS